MVLIGADHAPIETQAPADPRAQVLLRAAQNLDRAGKPKGAVAFYQQLVREFGGSDAADFAAGRIAALGGKVPDRSEATPPKRTDAFRPPTRRRAASQEASVHALDGLMGGINYGFPRAGPAGVAQIGVPPR
jgi:hypothetical protein